jgi:5-dehydro-2-deoxygluconokinase
MFELLVPAVQSQPDQVNGDKSAYDRQLRPQRVAEAIQDLQQAGVEPDVWSVEGLDHREDCEEVVATARREGRDKVGSIILGRGEDDRKVRGWLTTAAAARDSWASRWADQFLGIRWFFGPLRRLHASKG